MKLTDCENNLILTWSDGCVISSTFGKSKFKLPDTKLYVPVVTLPTQHNAKLLELLIPLGLTAEASATYGAIHQKMFGSGHCSLDLASHATTLIVLFENETKEQKGIFLGMLRGTLGASY